MSLMIAFLLASDGIKLKHLLVVNFSIENSQCVYLCQWRSDISYADLMIYTLHSDWAKKANWKNGGGNQGKAVSFPKAPFTPLYAFLAAKQLRIQKENPALSAKEVLVSLQRDHGL